MFVGQWCESSSLRTLKDYFFQVLVVVFVLASLVLVFEGLIFVLFLAGPLSSPWESLSVVVWLMIVTKLITVKSYVFYMSNTKSYLNCSWNLMYFDHLLMDHGLVGHRYWPTTHVTHPYSLTHLIHDPWLTDPLSALILTAVYQSSPHSVWWHIFIMCTLSTAKFSF